MTKSSIIALAALACAIAAPLTRAATPGITVRSVKGDFDEVKERIVMAIENRGLVIEHTARVGDMLDRTGKDIGRDRRIYTKAEVLEFCSADVSRTMMEADPRHLALCPYTIAVYALPGEAGKVYIAYRQPPGPGSGQSIKALREVATLLEGIVREAVK